MLFLYVYYIQRSYVCDYRSWLVYGICAGGGFATVENILYVFSGGIATAFTRAFLSVPLHMLCGGITAMLLFEQLEGNQQPVISAMVSSPSSSSSQGGNDEERGLPEAQTVDQTSSSSSSSSSSQQQQPTANTDIARFSGKSTTQFCHDLFLFC